MEASVGDQSRRLAEVQAEYQQESTQRQRLETRTRELSANFLEQSKILSEAQAQLENVMSHRQKFEEDASTMASKLKSIEEELSDRDIVEGNLRRAKEELESHARGEAPKFAQLETQLLKANAERQRVEAHATGLFKTQIESAQELSRRKQTEETLRRTRDELEVRVQHQAKELARVQTELENEICERQKVTVSGVETADGHAALVNELNERKQLELDLRLAKEQLASKLESQNTRLTQLQAKLLAEVSERQRLETHASDLGAAHVELGQQLTQKTETEAALRQAYVELGTAAEERLGRLCQTQAHLENTLTEQDQAVGPASELAQKKALVQEQLTERQKVEDSLRKTQKELEGRIETQAADLARTEAERKNQVTGLEQLEQRAAELAKVQIGLKQQLSQRTKTEEALRRAYAELGKSAQDRANELKATREQLQKEIAQRDHVEVEAARFAATQAAFEKELNARQ